MSRRFVARTTRIVEEFLVVALGIDVTGKKHVLGVMEGTTESEEVGKSLRVERARDLLRTLPAGSTASTPEPPTPSRKVWTRP